MSNIELGPKKYVQSRDLVEAHRLDFSAKLYDYQGPIARGGHTNPPDRPRYEKSPDRAAYLRLDIDFGLIT